MWLIITARKSMSTRTCSVHRNFAKEQTYGDRDIVCISDSWAETCTCIQMIYVCFPIHLSDEFLLTLTLQDGSLAGLVKTNAFFLRIKRIVFFLNYVFNASNML